MPKVSVIIPTYNRGYIVGQAIKSVLEQTLEDLELLVVDDGSVDNTKVVVANISDPRIKYFYKENGGVASALNFGIAKAQGSYIAILGSDNLWPKDFLKVLKAPLDECPDYGLAYTTVTQQHLDGTETESYGSEYYVSGQITLALFEHSMIPGTAVLIRKSVIPGFLFDENLRICEDNDAFLRLSMKTKFLFVPRIQVIRRTCRDSVTRGTYTTGSYIKALSLERFYFRLGGNRIIPAAVARRKLSHVYRRAGERHRKEGYRTAAIALLKKAIKYRPSDIRLYIGLVRVFLISRKKDKCPQWQMPDPLGPPYSAVVSPKGIV